MSNWPNVALGPVRAVDWTAKDGTKLQGIVTFPSGYTEGKRYPYLVLPHGGPEANDFLYFDTWARLHRGFGLRRDAAAVSRLNRLWL